MIPQVLLLPLKNKYLGLLLQMEAKEFGITMVGFGLRQKEIIEFTALI